MLPVSQQQRIAEIDAGAWSGYLTRIQGQYCILSLYSYFSFVLLAQRTPSHGRKYWQFPPMVAYIRFHIVPLSIERRCILQSKIKVFSRLTGALEQFPSHVIPCKLFL